MEPDSDDASRLPRIWFLECLATNKQVDYLTLRDVARKTPGLSGSSAMLARELLALRCLEGLAEIANPPVDPASHCSKIGLDLSQKCCVALFRMTSEAINSNTGLDGLDVSKWDIQSFVNHKRAQLPKSTLEQLEEMTLYGKDPDAMSLRQISGIKIIDHHEDVDMVDGVTKGVSSTCNGTICHQMGAGPENKNAKGSCQDLSKDDLLEKALNDVDLKKSTKDSHVSNNRPLMVSDGRERLADQQAVTSPLKEDGLDSGEKSQDNDIGIEQFSQQKVSDDLDDRSLTYNTKLSLDTSQVIAAQTILGDEIGKDTESPAKKDRPITTKCNPRQAVIPPVVEIKIPHSDRSQNVNGGPVGESGVKTSINGHERERESNKASDVPCNAEGYHSEDVDVASCKNKFLNTQHTTFDWTEVALCMKCNKSGDLLSCSSNVCSVAVHGDCLGAVPCFDNSGNFFCPFCASSLATAEYLKAKSQAGFRKKELNVYHSSSLSRKFPQRVMNKENKMPFKQDDLSYPMKRSGNEEKTETDRNLSNQNADRVLHVSPPAVVADSEPDREISNKAMGHCDHGITDEPPILRAEDILPLKERNKTTNSTINQPRDAFAQTPLNSEGFEHQNSMAIVLYEGNIGSDKVDTTSHNPPEPRSKKVKPVSNVPNTSTSQPTQHVPYQGFPAQRKRKVPWTVEEEEKLKEGVRRFYDPEAGSYIPWQQILEFGALVFNPRRTAENLKDKWRNICKKEGYSSYE